MLAQLKRLYLFIVARFNAEVPAPIEGPVPVTGTVLASGSVLPIYERRRYSNNPVWAEDTYGEFYFRETILDQLDYYMLLLKRMRRVDPSGFALYRQLGANVFPEATLVPMDAELEPWFRETLPSFGAVFWSKAKGEKPHFYYPRFLYFTKYDRHHAPPNIERAKAGTVYEVTVYWDKPEQGDKSGGATQFPILVRPDGTLQLLRSRNSQRITIKHRHGKDRYSSFHRQQWEHGTPFTRDWAAEHKQNEDKIHKGKLDTVEKFLVNMFTIVANNFERANSSMIRVTAERGSLAAVFGVNIKRTPYFFKDREVIVNEKGNRKRIFHIVRPHQRRSGSMVHMHFRGMREFLWNGYRILITVPGLHHEPVTEYNAGSLHAEGGAALPKGVIGTGLFARKVRNYIRTGKLELGDEHTDQRGKEPAHLTAAPAPHPAREQPHRGEAGPSHPDH